VRATVDDLVPGVWWRFFARSGFGLRDAETAIPNCEIAAILNQQSQQVIGGCRGEVMIRI
jgi:hypothetical protein